MDRWKIQHVLWDVSFFILSRAIAICSIFGCMKHIFQFYSAQKIPKKHIFLTIKIFCQSASLFYIIIRDYTERQSNMLTYFMIIVYIYVYYKYSRNFLNIWLRRYKVTWWESYCCNQTEYRIFERNIFVATVQRDNGHNCITNSICRNKRTSIRYVPLSRMSRLLSLTQSHLLFQTGSIVIRVSVCLLLSWVLSILFVRHITNNYFYGRIIALFC